MDELERLRTEILERTARYCRLRHGSGARPEFRPGESRVPYAGRVFDEREVTALVGAALDFWLTWGEHSKEFEARLASFVGARHALLVNSGSSANLLAVSALTSRELGERRIRPGDEVVTVAAAFPTTVAPIIQCGAVPVFVDVGSDGNIDCDALEPARSPRTRAVMVAHALGSPFDLDRVREFCDRHGLWLVEDNCDALGARWRGRLTGGFGDIGTSSFYPAHHLTTGEGGAVYTSDPLLHRILLSMRDWGRDCRCEPGRDNSCGRRFGRRFGTLPAGYDHKYVYSHLGYNLKATDLQAAVGCAQLDKLPEFIAARRRNHARLSGRLAALSDCFILPRPAPEAEPSWFGFMLLRRDGAPFTRNELAAELERRRIQTRNLFAGNLLRHPCCSGLREGRDFRTVGTLPMTDKIMNDALWIGVYPGMTDGMLDFMASTVTGFVESRRSGRKPVRGDAGAADR